MGFAVAKRLAEEGWHLTIVDLNESQGIKAVDELGGKATFLKADVTKYGDQLAAFEQTFTKHGRLDFVFANAGIAEKADFYDKPGAWPPKPPTMLSQEVNLTGVVYSSYLAMHFMRRNKIPGGVIVMTASGKSSPHERENTDLTCHRQLLPSMHRRNYPFTRHQNTGFWAS